jgi:minor extracellular serine protease Vpr
MLNKTILALAITSSLSVSAFAADKYQKYNFTNQPNVAVKSGKLNLENLVQKPTAWLIKLNTPSLSESSVNGVLSKSVSTQSTLNINKAQQNVIAAVNTLSKDIEVLAQTKNLVSGVIVKGSSQLLSQLLSNPLVSDILPIYDYELNVEASAEYMKGTPLVTSGVATGKGIRVAVLDTGVDYTHAAMGGPGTAEAYAEATEDLTDTPVWPQGNVVGGYDFMNNDPDPIDYDTSHGTHVSHSVLGLAPDAELYVYSVCGGGCPGLAQLLALEAAMDPNGDGDISDRVDVINMSLGGDFGVTRGGAVQEMLDQAANLGVVAAISAGNSGATPFIIGGPSTTKNVMSVGAMTHPTTESGLVTSSFNGAEVEAVAAGFNTEIVFSFSDADADLVYPDENREGCDAFADGTDFTGKAVIIDRGACNFTAKVINAQDKGAVFVIIANHTAGAGAPGLGGADDAVMIPSVGISFEDGVIMKEALAGEAAVTFSFSSESITTAGAIASFTSRGPSSDGWLKPEITAPGVSIETAYPGGGDLTSPISGTSFSSPMTAGAMALLREALPNRNALEIKATLMNAANLDVTMEPRSINADAALAPISFIGAGLVDVEKAVNLPVAAWDKDTDQAALAFGLMNLSATEMVTKTVTIKNFSSAAKTYALSLDQRFADDAESEAVSFDYPSSVTVPAGGSIDIDVTLTVDPTKLPEWTLTAEKLATPDGSNDLTTVEYDGALVFTDGDDNFHLVYHLLPKASSSVEVAAVISDEGVKRFVTNNGVIDLEAFAVPLTAEDEVGDSPYLDLQAASIEVLQVPTEFCASGYSVFTTFTMAEGMASINIGGVYADIDFDNDGAFDYSIQALPLDAFGYDAPGTTVTFTSSWDWSEQYIGNNYFTAGNNFVTLQTCIEEIGLAASDLGMQDATLRFRISDSQWDFHAETGLDLATVTGIDFAISNELVMLVDDAGEEVEMLAVGETAQLLTAGNDFVMLSDSGSSPLVAKPTEEAGVAPTVTEGQMFSVDENTENGTVIGMVMATDPDLYTSPVSEYFIQSSSSVAVMMDRDGTIKVADSTLLDHDAGLTSIELEVTAIDSRGNISESEMVTITVNNLLDEASEQPLPPVPTIPKPKEDISGGSFGWVSLLLLPSLWLRRKKK